MDRSEKKKAGEHVAVRLEAEDIARVEALRARLGTAWHQATRSDVLRAAILKGLEVIENEAPRSGRRDSTG